MRHGPFFYLFRLLVVTILVIISACTGQSPADIKNKITNTEEKISTSCQGIKFSGEMLTKENILKIFECGTWKNNYPHLYASIQKISDKNLNTVLSPYNKRIFFDSKKQGVLLDIISSHSKLENLEEAGKFINLALGEYKLINQIDLIMNQAKVSGINNALIFNIFSKNSKTNIDTLAAFTHFLDKYHQNQSIWDDVFGSYSKEVLVERGVVVLDELASEKVLPFWNSFSKIINSKTKYNLKSWSYDSIASRETDTLLVSLLNNKKLKDDSDNLLSLLDKGFVCSNLGSKKEFFVDPSKELVVKMTDLAELSSLEYQQSVVDGMAKTIAFINFCQSKDVEASLKYFASISDTIMRITENEKDYNFVSSIQKTLSKGEEFGILKLLASKGFESITLTSGELLEENKLSSFTEGLLSILQSVSVKDYDHLSDLMNELSKDSKSKTWYLNWAKMWNQLNQDQKKDFVNLLSIAVDTRIDSSKALRLINDIAKNFPEVTADISSQFEEEIYYSYLRELISEVSTDEVREDLTRFLSNDGMVSFLRTFTNGRDSNIEVSKREEIQKTNVINVSEKDSARRNECYEVLSKNYQNKTDYYTVVNNLPPVCIDSLGQYGLVGQIYLWMNHLNRDFKSEVGKEFHSGLGVWNPGMLQYIFSAAVKADLELGREKGLGVRSYLDTIKSDLKHPLLSKRIDLFLKYSKDISENTKLLDLATSYFAKMPADEFQKTGRVVFDIINSNAATYLKQNYKKTDCKKMNASLGVNPCVSSKELKESIYKILDIAKRKNENGDSVIKSFLSAFNNEKGVLLPRKDGKFERHVFTLEEIIRFTHDLNGKDTLKEFPYYTDNKDEKHFGTTIDRLEVIIRDISFLSNFYGAYFKNEVAQAESYQDKLRSSQKLMNWLQRLSGPFRSLGVFPKETKSLLKNAKHSYSSLIEVGDEYSQFDGGTRNYANFIQGILKIASSTSPLEAQTYSAYRKPDENIVKFHNGQFITEITKISGLRHLSEWVDSRFGENYTQIFKNPDFIQVNTKLFNKVKADKIEAAAEILLDRYYKNHQDSLAVMISDLIDWVYQAKPEEVKALESMLAKVLILISEDNITSDDFINFSEYVELIIKNWSVIKSTKLNSTKMIDLINLMNVSLDKILTKKSDSASLVSHFIKILKDLPSNERARLFTADNISNMWSILDSFANESYETKFPWAKVFKSMFFDQDMSSVEVQKILTRMVNYQGTELTPKDYIQFLSVTVGGKSRFDLFVEEVFVTQGNKLEKFLETTFQALELESD